MSDTSLAGLASKPDPVIALTKQAMSDNSLAGLASKLDTIIALTKQANVADLGHAASIDRPGRLISLYVLTRDCAVDCSAVRVSGHFLSSFDCFVCAIAVALSTTSRVCFSSARPA